MSQLFLEPTYFVQYFQCNAGAAASQPKTNEIKDNEIKPEPESTEGVLKNSIL
jgi:hypothetical protein